MFFDVSCPFWDTANNQGLDVTLCEFTWTSFCNSPKKIILPLHLCRLLVSINIIPSNSPCSSKEHSILEKKSRNIHKLLFFFFSSSYILVIRVSTSFKICFSETQLNRENIGRKKNKHRFLSVNITVVVQWFGTFVLSILIFLSLAKTSYTRLEIWNLRFCHCSILG